MMAFSAAFMIDRAVIPVVAAVRPLDDDPRALAAGLLEFFWYFCTAPLTLVSSSTTTESAAAPVKLMARTPMYPPLIWLLSTVIFPSSP